MNNGVYSFLFLFPRQYVFSFFLIGYRCCLSFFLSLSLVIFFFKFFSTVRFILFYFSFLILISCLFFVCLDFIDHCNGYVPTHTQWQWQRARVSNRCGCSICASLSASFSSLCSSSTCSSARPWPVPAPRPKSSRRSPASLRNMTLTAPGTDRNTDHGNLY